MHRQFGCRTLSGEIDRQIFPFIGDRHIEVHTAEPSVPEPCPSEVEIAIEKYKSSCSN
jgi:hypothetical protein